LRFAQDLLAKVSWPTPTGIGDDEFESDLTEKDVDDADSISISRKLSLRSSFSATSECGDDPELSYVVELKNPVLNASGDENMESAVPIDSKEPSSGILEDDGGLKEVV
jgi:hypothetical protein